MIHRNCEIIIIVCGFKPLTLGVIYSEAKDNVSHICAFYPVAPQILMSVGLAQAPAEIRKLTLLRMTLTNKMGANGYVDSLPIFQEDNSGRH